MSKQWIKTPVGLLTETGLSVTARLVYLYLAWRQGQNGSSWPSRERIAEDLDISFWAVKRAVKELKDKDCVSVIHPKSQGRTKTNHYTVLPLTFKKKGCTYDPLYNEKGGHRQPPKGGADQPVIRYKEIVTKNKTTQVLEKPSFPEPQSNFTSQTDKVGLPDGWYRDTEGLVRRPDGKTPLQDYEEKNGRKTV